MAFTIGEDSVSLIHPNLNLTETYYTKFINIYKTKFEKNDIVYGRISPNFSIIVKIILPEKNKSQKCKLRFFDKNISPAGPDVTKKSVN